MIRRTKRENGPSLLFVNAMDFKRGALKRYKSLYFVKPYASCGAFNPNKTHRGLIFFISFSYFVVKKIMKNNK